MGGFQSPVVQAWSPTGHHAINQVAHQSWALGMCTWASGLLIRVHTHQVYQVWVARVLISVCTHLGALGLCAQAAGLLIKVHTNRALGVC